MYTKRETLEKREFKVSFVITPDPMESIPRYNYYKSSNKVFQHTRRVTDGAIRLSRERLNPKLSNPNYLILRQRRKLFSQWLKSLPGQKLLVLDVGGRIQPYRPLVEDRLEAYIAIDPQLEGLLDMVAVGEYLPFADDTFDLVFCTQVLGYVTDPSQVINEIHRVLKQGAVLLLSVPTLFPRHHDERWRFLPDGLRILLSRFSYVEIAPEGYSVSSFFRTINVSLNIFIVIKLLRTLLGFTIIPLMNLAGLYLDKLSRGNDQFTTNNCAMARK